MSDWTPKIRRVADSPRPAKRVEVIQRVIPGPPTDIAVLVAGVVAAGFPEPAAEHRFLSGRRFRFDLAWPLLRVAFEREGASWTMGRHTSGKGYRNDCEKYSRAAIAGWCVVRATVDMMRDGTALGLVLDALRQRTTGGL